MIKKKLGKFILITLFILFSLLIFSQETSIYRDISKEHWAYKAIDNLTQKGIIERDSYFFNGEDSVSRYEMSFYLYRVLNKIDKEKATKDDLLILENLVGEFAEDLLKFGFDINSYTQKISEIEKSVNENKDISSKNTNDISELENRLKLLESYLLEENEIESEKTKILYRKFGIIENMDLKLNNSIYYYNNSETNKYNNKYDIEFLINNKFYEVGLSYKSYIKTDNKLNLKAKIEKNIDTYFDFKFNTIGYEKVLTSYFNTLDYDNYNYEKRDFYTDGIEIKIKNNFLYIERDREDEEKLYVIDKFTLNFFESLVIADLNNSNIEYELTLKKDFKDNKYGVAVAYSEINKKDFLDKETDISFINLNGYYKYKKWLINTGYEKKDSQNTLYNSIYSYLIYSFKDDSKIFYKIEFFDTVFDNYFNHHFIIKNESGKINTYFLYSKYNIDKNNYNNSSISIDEFKKENNFSEMIIKLKYNLSEKIDINVSYREEKMIEKNTRNGFYLIEIGYKFKENKRAFLRYLKNDEIYYDRQKDINYETIDLDFDIYSGIIDKAEDGRIELGLELKF